MVTSSVTVALMIRSASMAIAYTGDCAPAIEIPLRRRSVPMAGHGAKPAFSSVCERLPNCL
jgi:hypothetical protein